MRKYVYFISFFVCCCCVLNAQVNYHPDHITHVRCNGGNTGRIELSVTGGHNDVLSFYLTNANGDQLSGEMSNAIFEDLPAGEYRVQISINGANAVLTDLIVIKEPEKLKITSVSSIPTTCRIPADGTVTVNVSGGVAPYTFECDNFISERASDSHTFNGLSNKTYRVRVVDHNGCIAEGTNIVVGITPSPELTVEQSKLAACSEDKKGAITVKATAVPGGSNDFLYRLDKDGNWQPLHEFTDLAAKVYTITVKDGNGCRDSIEWHLEKKTQPTVSAEDCIIQCFNGVGSIEAKGVPDIDIDIGSTLIHIDEYRLYTAAEDDITDWQSSNKFYYLTAGEYIVKVRDIYGCEGLTSVKVSGPEAPLIIAQESVIKPFGNNKGSITVSVSGGWEGYTIVCNKVETHTREIERRTGLPTGNHTFENLDVGQYHIILEKDKGGCSAFIDREGTPHHTIFLLISLDQATGETEPDVANLKIYPNPSSDGRFIVEWNSNEDRRVTLEIFSMSGQLLYKTGAQTGAQTILDVGSLNQGSYLLRVPELNIIHKLTVQY